MEKKNREVVFIRAGCVLQMSASLEATGGWTIDGVCVLLVYLRTCMLCFFECLCVQNLLVATLARSQ